MKDTLRHVSDTLQDPCKSLSTPSVPGNHPLLLKNSPVHFINHFDLFCSKWLICRQAIPSLFRSKSYKAPIQTLEKGNLDQAWPSGPITCSLHPHLFSVPNSTSLQSTLSSGAKILFRIFYVCPLGKKKKIALHLLKSQNLKGFSSYILKLFIYLFLFLFEREQIESALLSFMV